MTVQQSEKPLSMVEHVARKLAEASEARCAGMYTLDALPMDGTEDFMALARAAIKAMREPTANMAMVGLVQSQRDDIDLTPQEVDDMWSAMIDAALSEESTP